MKLQKNTSLALYSVLEFARDPERHIAAAEIAEKYDISAHHLAKVLAELARSGILASVRGAGGGYRFTGKLREGPGMEASLLRSIDEDYSPRRTSIIVLPFQNLSADPGQDYFAAGMAEATTSTDARPWAPAAHHRPSRGPDTACPPRTL